MEIVHVGRVMEFPPAGNAAALRESGVRAVELGLFDEPLDCLDDAQGYAGSLAAECASCGLVRHSVHAPFGAGWDLGLADPDGRRAAIEGHLGVIAFCARLGAPILVVHPGVECPSDYEETYARARAALEELAEPSLRAGITLAVENLPPGYVCPSPREIRRLVDEIGHPAVRACLDTGHAHMTGRPIGEMVRDLAGVLVTIHAHDNDGSADRHQLPGEGSIDWPGFAQALRETGYRGRVVLELRAPAGHTPRTMEERFRAVARSEEA